MVVTDDQAKLMADVASQFRRYADLISAFAVAQALTFLYALGTDGPLRNRILAFGQKRLSKLVCTAALLYAGGTLLCGLGELHLRARGAELFVVLMWTGVAIGGRVVIILALLPLQL